MTRPLLAVSLSAALLAPRARAEERRDLDAVFDRARPSPSAIAAAEGAALPAPKGPRQVLEPIADSHWRRVGTVEDGYSERDPNAAERSRFFERLRDDSLWTSVSETVCREGQIPLKHSLEPLDGVVLTPSYERFLKHAPDGRLLLVDRTRLRVRLGGSPPSPLELEDASFGIGVGAEADGTSLVVRPLREKHACRELDRVADLRDIKFALPLKAERLAAMELDETWVVPVVFRASVGLGVGGQAAGVPLSVSFGYSREGGSSVSLRRLSDDVLRVRIRLDYVRVQGPSAAATYSILGPEAQGLKDQGREFAGSLLGPLVGEKLVGRLLSRQVGRWLDRYLVARLQWAAHWASEDRAVVEFLVDPRDARQLENLESALSGGKVEVLDSLAKLGRESLRSLAHRDDFQVRLEKLSSDYAEAVERLGQAARGFAGASRAWSSGMSLRFGLPALLDLGWSWGKRDERITLADEDGGSFDVYRAHSESSSGMFDLPFLGKLVALRAHRSAYAFTFGDGRENEAPSVVYLQQEGFTMQDQAQARNLAVQTDRLMRLAGTKGSGENPQAGLPLERVFPERGTADESPLTYRKGAASFTLALGSAAVADILAAPSDRVVRAYARSLAHEWYGDSVAKAVATGRVLPDGRVEGGEIEREHESAVRFCLEEARSLVKALHRIRRIRPPGSTDADSARRQSEALRDLLAGKSGLSYEDLLRVLVQLVEPEHLAAEFIVSAKPFEKGRDAVEGRYLYRRGLEEDAATRRLAETVARFRRSSDYSD